MTLDLKPVRDDILGMIVDRRRPLVFNVLATDTDGSPSDISGNSFQLTVFDARINNDDVSATNLENSSTVPSANITATFITPTTQVRITAANAATVMTDLRPHGRYVLEDLSDDKTLFYGQFQVVLLTDLL